MSRAKVYAVCSVQERTSLIPVDEGLYKKLSSLFPSLQEDELRQLCRKNYNNELAVMGDLTAKGFRPVYPTRTSFAPVTHGRYFTPPGTGSTGSPALNRTATPTAIITTATNVHRWHHPTVSPARFRTFDGPKSTGYPSPPVVYAGSPLASRYSALADSASSGSSNASPHLPGSGSYYSGSGSLYTGGGSGRMHSVVQDVLVKNRVSPPPPQTITPSGPVYITRTYSPVFGTPGWMKPMPERCCSTPPPTMNHNMYSRPITSSFGRYPYRYSPTPAVVVDHMMPSHPFAHGHPISSMMMGGSGGPPAPQPHYPSSPDRHAAPSPVLVTTASPCGQRAPLPNRTYTPPLADMYPMRPQTACPHSPKIKLRYLKRIFPRVDETVLLDVLLNSDNNVQIAMKELGEMGHAKVDTPPTRPSSAMRQEPQPCSGPRPQAPPRRLTEADKQKTRVRLLEKFKEVPAAVLTMALESVDFDEDRATILLSNVGKEEQAKATRYSDTAASAVRVGGTGQVVQDGSAGRHMSVSRPPVAPVRKGLKDRSTLTLSATSTAHEDVVMVSKSTWTQEDHMFRSRLKTDSKGPDTNYRKGPTLNLPKLFCFGRKSSSRGKGPNPENVKGPSASGLSGSGSSEGSTSCKSGSEGSSRCLTMAMVALAKVKAKGPRSELRQGPRPGLVQGSTYKDY